MSGLLTFASSEKPNFQDDIVPVFEQSCNSCHNPDRARGGLDLTSINAILAGGSSGEVSIPGDPDSSLLYLLPARLQEPHMPPRGEKNRKSSAFPDQKLDRSRHASHRIGKTNEEEKIIG